MVEQPIQSNVPSSDDRTMAGLCHIFGLWVALVIWLLQKDRSRYVRFQGAQAVAFDIVVMIVVFLVMGLTFGCMFLSIAASVLSMSAVVPMSDGSPSDITAIIFMLLASLPAFLPCGFASCLLPLAVGILIVRIIAAVKTFQGQDFRYPWLGRQVERILAN